MRTLCLLFAACALASGQTETPVLQTNGAFFALSVADVKAVAQWYTAKLGLKTTMEIPKKDGVAVVVLEGGGLIVELIERDDAKPLDKATSGITDPLRVHGIVKAGVIVDDFDKTVAALRARQVPIFIGPFPKRPTQRANLIIRDNAGNLIQFFGK